MVNTDYKNDIFKAILFLYLFFNKKRNNGVIFMRRPVAHITDIMQPNMAC